MKFYKIIIVAASVFALVACSTSKEISYFQDLRPGESELMRVSGFSWLVSFLLSV